MPTEIRRIDGRKAIYLCSCGAEFAALISNVKRGGTKSCGCLRRSMTIARSTKHGAKSGGERTQGYVAWVNMKARCDKDGRDAKNYKERGISYDPRWASFAEFIADMGEPPEGTSLDRIDNGKGYSASNCRWAERKTQASNRRNVFMYEHDGKTMHLADWAKHVGINRVTLLKRLQRGIDFKTAISCHGYLKDKRP